MMNRIARDRGARIAVGAILLAVLLLGAAPAWAQTDVQAQPGPPNAPFGLVGIARGQTARINVWTHPGPPELPPSPCVATLSFFDEHGTAMTDRSGNPVSTRVSLLPGEAAALEMRSFDIFAGSTAMRRMFRASVEMDPGPPELPPSPCAGLTPTLEIYDVFSSRTQVLYANPGPPEVQMNPGPPDVRFGLLGMARWQTARVNVWMNPGPPNTRTVDLPPSPCVATLSFFDEHGAAIADRSGNPVSTRVSLLPGEAAALELRWPDAFRGSTAMRKMFRASVEMDPGPPNTPDACAGLTPTLEIYEVFTGRTQVLYTNPGPPTVQTQPGPPQ